MGAYKNSAVPDHFADLLPEHRIFGPSAAAYRYGADTTGAERYLPMALQPESRAEVIAIVRRAAEIGVSIYPISAGHNWGYGTSLPNTSGSIIVDLSNLREVDGADIDLGVVTVEPGVTQARLRDYLNRYAPQYLVPVHGGGPTCSVLGNALERGYGITPYTDHFAAVTAIEAVLPDGSVYRGPLTEAGAASSDRLYKWGTGPYVEGLFTQGGFGVVTRVSIALARRPERTMAFMFHLPRGNGLPDAITRVQRILSSLGSSVGGVNLMNTRRVLSMTTALGPDTPTDTAMEAGVVAELARQHHVAPWTGFGTLYGDRGVVAAARRRIRRELRGLARGLLFLDPGRIRWAYRLTRRMPGLRGTRLAERLATLDRSLRLVEGEPSEIALALAYWRPPGVRLDEARSPLDPARDGRGLIWYAPIVPMRPATVTEFVARTQATCIEHGIEPLITLTSQSDRCFDSTVPLLFDRNDPAATRRARACYGALLEHGKQIGCVPYRYPIDAQSDVVDVSSACWKWIASLKRATDPFGVLAPGRYAPPPDPGLHPD